MFNNLTDRLSHALKNIKGQGRLTEDNIKDTLREVRIALLEADVALPIVKTFIEQIREKALGQDVLKSLSPGQALVKIVNDELVHIMGEACAELNLQAKPPAVILVAGLQGSGKTTTIAKLARWLKETEKKEVLVVSADVYRPAAIDQLERLATEVGVGFCPSKTEDNPINIAHTAIDMAKRQFADVLLVDTAGRLHVDDKMMSEIKALHKAINPVETLFVVDSMTGQDASNTAKAFDEALPLTGVILTKVDGDARGGAALSIRQVTGKPIKFIGVGEKTDALQPFHPERIASQILGMGDIVSLVEEAERTVDKKQAEKMAKKLKKGVGFDLEDFLMQIQQMKKMGGMGKLMEKMPGMGKVPPAMKNQFSDDSFKRFEALINSMTPHERRFPAVIRASRKQRVLKGSGSTPQDFNQLMKQYTQMQKMMKKFSKGGMKKMMKKLQGHMPPDDGNGMGGGFGGMGGGMGGGLPF